MTNTRGWAATATTKGILRPDETEASAGLRRDYPVAPELAPFVERYWSVRWDRTSQPVFRAEVLGHPCVNLSVESGDHPRFGFELPAVLVHGVATRRSVVELVGVGRVTAAKFRPGGFAAFTGAPPMRDRIVRLGPELGVDGDSLLAAVLAEDDDDRRTAVLDAALATHAPEPPLPYLDLVDLVSQMLDDRSLTRVEDLAARAGMTVRSLQRLFAMFVGVGPKAVLARYRLHDAIAAIDAGEDDLAGLAASLGWFDQAHFTRDFRAAVGTTPSAYLRRVRVSAVGV